MALPTTSWVPISWYDREVMTELKLDSQQGNADYLRDQMRNRSIFCCATYQYGEFNTGASCDELSQIRIRIQPYGYTKDCFTNEVFLHQAGGGWPYYIESYWEVVSARNFAWTITPGTGLRFEFEWQWRYRESSGWSTLGVWDVWGVGCNQEIDNYVTFFAEIQGHANARRSEPGHYGWISPHLRGCVAIGGYYDEQFSEMGGSP